MSVEKDCYMNDLKIISVFFLCMLSACGDDINPGVKRLKVYADAAVQEESPYVTSGDQLVFHFYRMAEDVQNIADDEFAEDLFLEIIEQIHLH